LLRERGEDLPALISALQDSLRRRGQVNRELRIDTASLAILRGHSWPGNVRELRNLLERRQAQLPEGHTEVDAETLRRLAPELLHRDPPSPTRSTQRDARYQFSTAESRPGPD
jgi:transcriptional regulator with PAS, ATPase and Fis domain